MLVGDSVPAERNMEEVQENNSSRHDSVTVAVANVQTTSKALTEVVLVGRSLQCKMAQPHQ